MLSFWKRLCKKALEVGDINISDNFYKIEKLSIGQFFFSNNHYGSYTLLNPWTLVYNVFFRNKLFTAISKLQ